MQKLDRVGEKYITREGYEIEIIEYIGKNNCTIKFNDRESNIKFNIAFKEINIGAVKNLFHPSVFGIGYIGKGKYVISKNKKATKNYSVWNHMLRRCYSEKYHEKEPTYKGCSVHPDWHNFQVFAEWFEKNYVEGFELDKDILFKGNKVYSPETCCFVPHEVNKSLKLNKSQRGKYPIGISKQGNKYRVSFGSSGYSIYLGLYNFKEEAFKVYKKYKEEEVKNLANTYKCIIDSKVYEALINYKVEIDD